MKSIFNKTTRWLTGIILVTGLSSATLNYYAPLHTKPAPTGHTGATGVYCTECHSGNALNYAGGSIAITGMPANYAPSQIYPFSLTIKHGAIDRKKFGFAIIAVNKDGVAVGNFSTSNSYATPSGSELVSYNPPALTATNTYTFDNLFWTAPAITSGSNESITFYYVGNATNYNLSTSGDFIYAGTFNTIPNTLNNLPVKMTDFTLSKQGNQVLVHWSTSLEQNTQYFSVEKSPDGLYFSEKAQVKAAGNSDYLQQYFFTDTLKETTPSTLYYRIATVDLDGHKTYSPVRSIQLESTRTYIRNYYPNPVQIGKELKLEIVSQHEGFADIQMWSTEGIRLSGQKIKLIKGVNQLNVRVPYSALPGRIVALISVDDQMLQVPVLISRQ